MNHYIFSYRYIIIIWINKPLSLLNHVCCCFVVLSRRKSALCVLSHCSSSQITIISANLVDWSVILQIFSGKTLVGLTEDLQAAMALRTLLIIWLLEPSPSVEEEEVEEERPQWPPHLQSGSVTASTVSLSPLLQWSWWSLYLAMGEH